MIIITLNAFGSPTFPIKATWLKILSLKQMLQRLPIALAQEKLISGSLLNEIIWQIIYSLDRAKEITKKVITI